uniref:Uncharacterized protein n=1 Tax=uncultured marine virus TaxID=186617 RepID=A0A0F7L958_9VIRU|nr:hypothetical protein [uncultured marine virus]
MCPQRQTPLARLRRPCWQRSRWPWVPDDPTSTPHPARLQPLGRHPLSHRGSGGCQRAHSRPLATRDALDEACARREGEGHERARATAQGVVRVRGRPRRQAPRSRRPVRVEREPRCYRSSLRGERGGCQAMAGEVGGVMNA